MVRANVPEDPPCRLRYVDLHDAVTTLDGYEIAVNCRAHADRHILRPTIFFDAPEEKILDRVAGLYSRGAIADQAYLRRQLLLQEVIRRERIEAGIGCCRLLPNPRSAH